MNCGCCQQENLGNVQGVLIGTRLDGEIRADHGFFSIPGPEEFDNFPSPEPGGWMVAYNYTAVWNKYLVATGALVGTEDGRTFSAEINSVREWVGDGAGGLTQTQFADFDDPGWAFAETVTGSDPTDNGTHYFLFAHYRWNSGDWATVGSPATAANPVQTSAQLNVVSIVEHSLNDGVYHRIVRGPVTGTVYVAEGQITDPDGVDVSAEWDCSGCDLGVAVTVVRDGTDEVISTTIITEDSGEITIDLPTAPAPEEGYAADSHGVSVHTRSLNHCRKLSAPPIV